MAAVARQSFWKSSAIRASKVERWAGFYLVRAHSEAFAADRARLLLSARLDEHVLRSYIKSMPTPPPWMEWDARKAVANPKKHGLSFALAERFPFESALEALDPESDEHGEERILAIGKIERTFYALCYTSAADFKFASV